MKTKKVFIVSFLVVLVFTISFFFSGLDNKKINAAMDENYISNDNYLNEPIDDETNPFILDGSEVLYSNTETKTINLYQYEGLKIPITQIIETTYSIIYEKRTSTEDFCLQNIGPVSKVTNDKFRFIFSTYGSFNHSDYLKDIETWAISQLEQKIGTKLRDKVEAKVKYTYNNSRGGSVANVYSDTTSYGMTFDQEMQPPFGPGIYTFQLRGKVREYRIMLRRTMKVTFRRGFSKPTVTTSCQDSEQKRFRVVENLPTLTDNPYLALRKIANLAF